MADEVPESPGADSRQGSGGCRWLRFRRVPVQMTDEVPKASVADGVRFRRDWYRKLMRYRRIPGQVADEVPEVPVQMADEVLEGSGADSK